MTRKGGAPGEDFEALARQYWNAWGEALRQAGADGGPATADPAAQDWPQALSWWRSLLADTAPAAQDSVDRFSGQAGDWLGLMQQVAARFAGRDTSSEEVANAWRQAVQGQREQLLEWTLGALRGGVAGGFDPWLAQAARNLEQWQRDSAPWLQMPAFGLGRNHQARWQAFSRAQQDYQARSQEYVAQLRAALDQAFDRFQAKLSEHEALGSQLTSARALFDLWIEAAEEAYAGVALSEEFRQIYGAYANAHMRLRAAVQQEVEQIASQYGMPTRSEMDAAHKRIAELERAVRRLAAGRSADVPPGAAAPARSARPDKRTSSPAGGASKTAPGPATQSHTRGATKASSAAAPAPGVGQAARHAGKRGENAAGQRVTRGAGKAATAQAPQGATQKPPRQGAKATAKRAGKPPASRQGRSR